jgi:hypothetical protein
MTAPHRGMKSVKHWLCKFCLDSEICVDYEDLGSNGRPIPHLWDWQNNSDSGQRHDCPARKMSVRVSA